MKTLHKEWLWGIFGVHEGNQTITPKTLKALKHTEVQQLQNVHPYEQKLWLPNKKINTDTLLV